MTEIPCPAPPPWAAFLRVSFLHTDRIVLILPAWRDTTAATGACVHTCVLCLRGWDCQALPLPPTPSSPTAALLGLLLIGPSAPGPGLPGRRRGFAALAPETCGRPYLSSWVRCRDPAVPPVLYLRASTTPLGMHLLLLGVPGGASQEADSEVVLLCGVVSGSALGNQAPGKGGEGSRIRQKSS